MLVRNALGKEPLLNLERVDMRLDYASNGISSSLRDAERCPQTMAVAGNELSSDEEGHGSRVWKRDGCMTDDQSRK